MVEMANNNKAYKCNDLIEYLHISSQFISVFINDYLWLSKPDVNTGLGETT